MPASTKVHSSENKPHQNRTKEIILIPFDPNIIVN